MNKNKSFLLSLFSLLMLSMSYSSHATVITSGCASATSCTVAELVAGGEISVDDVTFENWLQSVNFFFETDGTDVTGSLDLASIIVSGINAVATGNPNEFTLGLLISTTSGFSLPQTLGAVDEAELELDLEFDVTTSGTTSVNGAGIELGSRNLGSADSFVEANLDGGGVNLQVFDEIEPGGNASVLTDDEMFAAILTAFPMTTNVQAGTFEPGTVGLFAYSIFLTITADPVVTNPPGTPIPAPATLPLLILALFLIISHRSRLTK